MKDEFDPPIRERTSDELLDIVSETKKWQPVAVRIANEELARRNVKPEPVEQRKYIRQKEEKIENLTKEKESYDLLDFIFHPFETIFEIFFCWELKKDGYVLKAKQRKYFLLAFALITIVIFILLQ